MKNRLRRGRGSALATSPEDAGRAVRALETQADAAALTALADYGARNGLASRAILGNAVDTLARRLAIRASADAEADTAEHPENDAAPPRTGAERARAHRARKGLKP